MKLTPAQQMMVDDGFPPELFMTVEERKALWEANPPRVSSSSWRSSEQMNMELRRQQAKADERRMNRCLSKQRRINRELTSAQKLEDRKASGEGKRWDVRTAKWIEPVEKAKKETNKTNGADVFGLRPGTNYHRMIVHLLDNLGKSVKITDLAKVAYGTKANIAKHAKRVQVMARNVQRKIIAGKNLAYEIKKEHKGDEVRIGLFEK